MTAFLNESPQMKETLSLVNEFVKQPTNEEIEEMFNKVDMKLGEENTDRKWMNHQLYQVLSLNLTGNALGTIKNMIQEKEINGVLGWWKLGKEVNAMTAQRLQGLAGKVYSPKRVKKY